MSEPSVGSVSVDVVPDARRFPPRLAKQVNPEAAKIGAQFGKLFGGAAQQEMSRGVRDGIAAGGRDLGPRAAKQGETYGGSFARALKARLEAAFKSLPDVEINADSSGADREIASIRAQLVDLRDKRIGIDIDAAEANRRVDELSNHLRLLSQQSPEVAVRVDSGTAAAELAKFQAEVNRLDGQTVEVDVDVDTAAASAQLAALGSQARGSGAGFAALLGAALLLGPALIPIGAAGAGAMAAIASGALAAAGGLGVLILALAPVIGAVQAVQQAHDKSASSARGSTGAHLQMASAMDAVKAANRGLASAEEDARIARVSATQAIAAAERTLAEAKRQAARDQVESDRRIVDAERSVAAAQRDALDAQRALSDARKQAARDAEDLAARVSGGILDERDANLRLEEARQRAAEVNADPEATELERRRAQLAVDQAVQGLQDQQRENIRLRAEKAASDQAGVEGSKAVQDAQDAVRESQQKLTDSQEGVTQAVETAAERRRRATDSIVEAQRRVADATRDAEIQQRRSAEAIVSAQQAVVSAQRGVQQASQSAGAAGGAALETMRQKLADLSPAGREFVTFITGTLLPALRPLGNAAQTAVLPGLQTALTALLPVLPAVSRLISTFGEAVAGLAVEAVESLDDPVWRDFFSYLQSDGAAIMVTVARTVGNLAKAFAGLAVAFAPVTNAILGGLLSLSRRFADFAANATPTSGLGRFIAYIQDIGPQVARTFGDIAAAVGHILVSLAPLGPVVLTVVSGLARLITALPASVIAAIVVGIAALAGAIALLNAGLAITNAVLLANPVVRIVGGIVVAIAALVAAVVVLWKNNETFRAIVISVWTTARDFISAAIVVIRAAFESVRAYLANVLGPAFLSLWRNVIQPVWTGIRIAVSVAWVAIQMIFRSMEIAVRVLAAIFLALWHTTIEPVWSGISTTISFAWTRGIRPVLSALGDFLESHVVPAFRRGVEAIGRAWEGIKDAAKAPVRFVIDTVINNGIIDTFNQVADFFKVGHVDRVALPKGFATGGYVTGPGGPRDDLVPAMLSNGEFVINAQATASNLELLKYLNRGGSLGGDPAGVARFASGGLVEATKKWLPSVDPLPYVWGGVGPGGFDCSGLAGEVWARVTEHARNSRYFTTSSNLGASGFAPGLGLFSLGVDPGHHMVGNLGGLGFEARSTATGIFVGPSATSPAAMPQQWHLASLPGGSKAPDGISLLNPIESFRALLSSALDGADRFTDNPFGRLAVAMPKAIIGAAGDFISDHVPGFADGGLVGKVAKYDDGGYLPPGLSTVVNLTGKPEPVLTSGQWSTMRGGGDRPTVVIEQTNHYPAPEVPSESLARGMRKVAAFGLIPAKG